MALDWQVDNTAGLPVSLSLSNADYYSRESSGSSSWEMTCCSLISISLSHSIPPGIFHHTHTQHTAAVSFHTLTLCSKSGQRDSRENREKTREKQEAAGYSVNYISSQYNRSNNWTNTHSRSVLHEKKKKARRSIIESSTAATKHIFEPYLTLDSIFTAK